VVVLCSLVDANVDDSLNKPIVLQIGAILEASLIQIVFRAQHFNREGVPNIVETDRKAIEEKKIDKFAVAIDIFRKYGILDGIGADIYEKLHALRQYRNKIHIQEDVKVAGAPRDEEKIFTSALVKRCLDTNRTVLEFLSTQLARSAHIDGHCAPLTIPVHA